ncbi:hypothetical protein DRJ22_02775 [Candidatus Woesearchaeota archaeon]|nr:MAG: hypothetical protein DRJ22_02775 [Candidatus Woesearchaeota archaeon]
MEKNEKESNQPEKRFSSGGIVATVWRNQRSSDGKAFEYNTVSIQRRYSDKSGNWQSTNTFRINDLPKAALVLEEAYKYLVMRNE